MSICITVLIIEFASRLLPTPYSASNVSLMPLFNDQADDIFTCDNNIGWTGTPNFEDVVELSGFQTHLNFNSFGMHDTEHPLEKAPNTSRILMLGDSFVQAIQVGEADTSHQILEDYLNRTKMATPTHFEVLSAGVASWGTGQQLLYYRKTGRYFNPDLVLLMLFPGNDVDNNLPGKALTVQGFNCYAPYFTLCDGQINPNPLKYAPGISRIEHSCATSRRLLLNAMGTLYQNSRLYQQLEPLIISYRPRQMYGSSYPHPLWAIYMDDYEFELEYGWHLTEATIGQLKKEVEADGANFAVAFFPHAIVVQLASLLSPAEREALRQTNPEFASVDLNRPNRRLTEFFGEQNIPFINLAPLLLEKKASNESLLYFPGDGHWTVEGNRFVARALKDWLIQNKLVSN